MIVTDNLKHTLPKEINNIKELMDHSETGLLSPSNIHRFPNNKNSNLFIVSVYNNDIIFSGGSDD